MSDEIYICECGFRFVKGQSRKSKIAGKPACPVCKVPVD